MRKEGGPLVARSKAWQEKSPDTGTSARLTPGLTREATPLPLLSESLLCNADVYCVKVHANV